MKCSRIVILEIFVNESDITYELAVFWNRAANLKPALYLRFAWK